MAYDVTVKIENQSPYEFSLINTTLHSGEWTTLPPTGIKSFGDEKNYGMISGFESIALVWNNIILGDTSRVNYSKTLASFSFYSQISPNSKVNNEVDFSGTLMNVTLDPFLAMNDLTYFINLDFWGKVGFNGDILSGVLSEGFPGSFNITGSGPTMDGKTFLWKLNQTNPSSQRIQDLQEFEIAFTRLEKHLKLQK